MYICIQSFKQTIYVSYKNQLKMKKLIYSSIVVIFTLISCVKNDKELSTTNANALVHSNKPIAPLNGKNPMSKTQLDNAFLAILQDKNDFKWQWLDDYQFWSTVQKSDGVIAIGYQPSSVKGNIADYIHEIDIHTTEWRATHDALIDFIKTTLKNQYGEQYDDKALIFEDDNVLPRIAVRVNDYALLAKLRRIENLRYVEPLGYSLETTGERSSSGCSGTQLSSLPAGDYTVTSPNAIVPWNFTTMNIPNAWNISGAANGAGMTIGVIDAGISSSQALLNSQFSSGASTGRSVTTAYTLGTSAYNTCTHGTCMAGLATGPRNSVGATMGVAWKSNLHFIRACNDVVLDGSDEQTAVKNALIQMGNNANVKIVSMSLGTPFSSGTLEDGVNYAYGMGKLIFAAGGTSFSWTSWWGVIYPAKLAKCVAMTGIKENGSTCDVCHDGSEIDFTITMERNVNSDRNSLSYYTSGTLPSYVGGSSTATAMGAGIASLVWSSKPSLTRDQVLNILNTTAQYYPSKSSSYGYGKLNAVAAVNKALSY